MIFCFPIVTPEPQFGCPWYKPINISVCFKVCILLCFFRWRKGLQKLYRQERTNTLGTSPPFLQKLLMLSKCCGFKKKGYRALAKNQVRSRKLSKIALPSSSVNRAQPLEKEGMDSFSQFSHLTASLLPGGLLFTGLPPSYRISFLGSQEAAVGRQEKDWLWKSSCILSSKGPTN